MRTADFIQRKLQAWAHRRNISLQGSEGERGQKNYTLKLEDNLFGNILHVATQSAFDNGAGGELRGPIPAMCALHSSAAMAVNLFQYWHKAERFHTLAELLNIPRTGITEMAFEKKYPVCKEWRAHGFTEPPHLDLGIEYGDSTRVGVECKLFEPYGRLAHAPLRSAYLELKDTWTDIPACRALAEEIAVGDSGYKRLGPAQLLRHILGLKYGKPVDKVRLVYLYLDAIGDDAEVHREEIRRFQKRIAPDPVRFIPLSVQEFIVRALRRCRAEHEAYVDYLADRYL